ncbi:Xyloglucan endotransglucosylase/hydrolase [Psidium guajava]|nr:Xyloglucan endotransglucosylase/hydrolase [Psidium guajava]
MDAISRVNHPNVVRLRAYYYASNEKLLVSDFIRDGCLYSTLHGNITFLHTYSKIFTVFLAWSLLL